MGADNDDEVAFLAVVVDDVGLRFLALRTESTDETDEALMPLPALEAVRGRGGVSLALAFFLTLNTVRFLVAVVVVFAVDFAALGVVLASLLPTLPPLLLLLSDGRLCVLMGVN